MHRAVLLLFFVLGVGALYCPGPYTDDGNGNCQSARRTPTSQLQAYISCGQDNSFLITIQNAFENSKAIHLAGDYDSIWLGMSCQSSNRNSCLWDSGIQINDTTYTNFAPGHPDISIGTCVYSSSLNGGFWYSASCNDYKAPFVCRNTPNFDVPLCVGTAYYYRGHCYFPVSADGYEDGRSKCGEYYADLASIHNVGEDSFIRDVAVSNPSLANASFPNYAFIGLFLSGSEWSDNTTVDYQNFGYRNSNLGNCVFLATANDAIPPGKWMNNDCMRNTVAVCKRNLTDFPAACMGQQYLSGFGDIYSPSFPSSTQSIHCEYIINPDTGRIATFTFVALSLDANSTIKFYNTIFDRDPFVTLTNGFFNNQTYYSASNLLKVVFDSPANGFFKNFWVAAYGEQAQGPNNCGGNYTKTGRISGPDESKNCTYTLTIQTSFQTCIKFVDISLVANDSISIYEGDISPNNQIAYIAPGFMVGVQNLALCTVNPMRNETHTLNIVTTGLSGQDYDWFTLNVAGSPWELNPTPLYNNRDDYWTVPDVGKNASFLYDKYTGHQIIEYYSVSTPQTPIRVNFSYVNMPFPNNNIVLIDGSASTPVAMAFGVGSYPRTTFPFTLSNSLTVAANFHQVDVTGQLVGYVGMFTHA